MNGTKLPADEVGWAQTDVGLIMRTVKKVIDMWQAKSAGRLPLGHSQKASSPSSTTGCGWRRTLSLLMLNIQFAVLKFTIPLREVILQLSEIQHLLRRQRAF